MKYYLATYGCQMNEYDSGMVASMLEEQGYQQTDQETQADVVIVNTCSIRGKAEENIYNRIEQMAAWKKKRPQLRIAVIGCMAESHGEGILQRAPHVDIVAGPDQYRKLTDLLINPHSPKPVLTGFDHDENYADDFAKLLSPWSTHITIQRGCNKRCSYCIVPFTRGTEKYRPTAQILQEIQQAVDQGVQEIQLLGQTVNSYRDEENNFARLLTLCSEINGVKRIRFTSPHPRHYSAELLDVLTRNPKICPHTHLPLQSGSNRILKSMRRQYDREDYLAIVETLRHANPFYGITTDIIVGFTGETETDFQETLDLVKQVQFDHAFMFAYSKREGTESWDWPDELPETVKQERLQRLIDLQNTQTLARHQQMLGQQETVLIEGPSSRNVQEWMGKTGNFKKVILPAGSAVVPGQIVPVRITGIKGWTLRGELL